MVLLKIDCIHRCAHTLNLVPGYYSCTRTKFTLHSSVYTWRTCRGTVPYRYDRSTAVVPRYPTTAVVPRYRTSSRSIQVEHFALTGWARCDRGGPFFFRTSKILFIASPACNIISQTWLLVSSCVCVLNLVLCLCS
jgi:hypothetical protein